MPLELLPEMVESGLGPVRHALEQAEDQWAPHDFRGILYALDGVIANLLWRMWEEIQEGLREGIEGRRLVGMAKRLQETVTAAIPQFTRAHETASQKVSAYPGKEEDLARLAGTLRRAEAMRDDLATLLQLIDVPPPAVDPSLWTPTGSPPAPGKYTRLRDILARRKAARGS